MLRIHISNLAMGVQKRLEWVYGQFTVPFWERESTWEDLVEALPDRKVPLIDRSTCRDEELTPDQVSFRRDGVLILPGFMPTELIENYCEARKDQPPGGFPTPTPYKNVSEIKDICLHKPLTDKLEELIGEPMAMHLNLTGWVSTERDWHQDEYLNPPSVVGWYVAVWMALDDIHPDSGPFEYVPGSHKWEVVRRNKVFRYLTPREVFADSWPKASERFLSRLFNEQVEKHQLTPQKFIAKKGDVLIWHSRLMHRGTKPIDSNRLRKSLITHYSGVNHRPENWPTKQHKDGGYFFVTNF